MSHYEERARSGRTLGKGVIAAPPRVALSGSSQVEPQDDNAFIKSATDGNGPESNKAEPSTKDRRIASLEAKIADYERELVEYKKKRQEESETAAFWQQKHSSLHQTFLKTDTDLRLLRQEVASHQHGREERERDRELKTRISSLLLNERPSGRRIMKQ